MEQSEIRQLLQAVAAGERSVDDALLQLKEAPFEDLGFAKLDITARCVRALPRSFTVRAKRRSRFSKSRRRCSSRAEDCRSHGFPKRRQTFSRRSCRLPILSSGASVLRARCRSRPGAEKSSLQPAARATQPVAEEAALTAEALGNEVVRLYDVGVAGLHRLLSHTDDVMQAQAIVAIAGMEGALASVIGGLADCPVIAVPTSVGYGASFGGVAALLAMLNSCASGVSVVNIDNGFGAGYLASMINHIGT